MARSKVADALRREGEQATSRMTPGELVRLAFELGERDLRMFMAANGLIDPIEAKKALDRASRIGRPRSRCIEELLK